MLGRRGEPWTDVTELAFQYGDLVSQRQEIRILLPVVAQGSRHSSANTLIMPR